MAERQTRTDSHIRPPAPPALPSPVADNHTHLDHCGEGELPTDEEVAWLLEQGAAVGVPNAVQIGCSLEAARWTVDLLDRFSAVIGGVALHPNVAPRLAQQGLLSEALDEIRTLAQHPRVYVVGETGLDFFRTDPGDAALMQAQEESFRAHISLAKELDLVLQVHDRDAHEATLRVLAEEGAPERTVLHCFSGDAEMARECVRRGYYLSFAGTLTFRNSADLRAAFDVTPPELALVETDAPYLTPVPYRGRPNASYLVPLTVTAMAELRGTRVSQVCEELDTTSSSIYPGAW